MSNPVKSALSPSGSERHLLIQVENLSKSYSPSGRSELRLFHNLDLSITSGELVAIVGQSGAGKSTLLHMLGALDLPTEGSIRYNGTALEKLRGYRAADFRNREVGFVWQFHYLLPEFTAAENIAMPLLARGLARKQALAEANTWLGRIGLAERRDHRAGELSGGEQQRVSLARALITKPRLLLADEPTGDLDGATAEAVFGLLTELHREQGLTTVLVTHNMALAHSCGRVLRLENGKLLEVPFAGEISRTVK